MTLRCANPTCGTLFVVTRSDRRYCSRSCASLHGHYRKFRPKPKPTWRDIFWTRVRKSDRCWVWEGFTTQDGYGKFGHTHYWSRSYMELGETGAHRISWILAHGPIPSGLWVLHKCDNPPCVNPAHLFLGTLQDNSLDREAKHRGVPLRGTKNPQAKLTEITVTSIREMWDSGKWTQTALGKLFGLSQPSISDIIHRKTWGHLE